MSPSIAAPAPIARPVAFRWDDATHTTGAARKSDDSGHYTVRRFATPAGDVYRCECSGFFFRERCKHVAAARADHEAGSLTAHYCACGCGQTTNIIPANDTKAGRVKGEYAKYVAGHQRRLTGDSYTVEDCGYVTPCWLWKGARSDTGYGNARNEGKGVEAHIVSYERANGPVPQGMELDHKCRVRACIRPDHLEAVSHAVNAQRGASAKVTPEKVAYIRTCGKSLTQLAKELDIHSSQVSRIRSGKNWSNIPWPGSYVGTGKEAKTRYCERCAVDVARQCGLYCSDRCQQAAATEALMVMPVDLADAVMEGELIEDETPADEFSYCGCVRCGLAYAFEEEQPLFCPACRLAAPTVSGIALVDILPSSPEEIAATQALMHETVWTLIAGVAPAFAGIA